MTLAAGEKPSERQTSHQVPRAAAFAAFPLTEENISLLGDESVPAGEAENASIGNVHGSSFLGAEAKFQEGPGVDASAAQLSPKIEAPIFKLQAILTQTQEKPEETDAHLEGEKLSEERQTGKEGLQMRIRLLEDELSELRDALGVVKKRDTKVKAFLDYVNVLGSYYMKNCKYYDQDGWCTNWFWNSKPNFENPDGSKIATRRGEDGKYYIKPNVFICSLCNAATSKFWV